MAVSLFSPASNSEMGWFLSRLFPLLRGADPRNAISQVIRPFFPGPFVDSFRVKTDNETASYVGGDNQLRLLLIDGVETPTQTNRLINGYGQTHGLFDLQGLNPWLQNAADSIMQAPMFNNVIQPFQEVLIAGYSAGGAIGQWCLSKWQASGHVRNGRLVTFGSPRAMSNVDASPLFALDVCRWMVDADPIPLVPPRFEDAPILHLALGVQLALIYGTYIHLQNGFSLDAAGNVSPQFTPPLASANVTGSLVSWYQGKANDPTNPHWIGNYEDRLFLLKQRQAGETGGIVGGEDAEPAENAPRREQAAAERAVAGAIAHRAAIQNAQAVNVANVVLFRAVRFNRVWCVEFGDKIICFAGNKKRARHLARVGNDFLRSLPKQAVVDPDSLVSQFENFMTAAVQPGGPVTPAISVGL